MPGRGVLVAATVALGLAATPARATGCPRLIHEAETLVETAKAAGAERRARPHLEQALRLITEAHARHRDATDAHDHGHAMTTARVAKITAELARRVSEW